MRQHRARTIIGAAVAAVAVITALAAGAGAQTAAPAPDVITVTKVVTGDSPPGALFLVRVSCDYDVNVATDGVQDEAYLAFGAGQPETQSVALPASDGLCVVTETNDGGAVFTGYRGGPASHDTRLRVTSDFVEVDWETPNIDGGESALVTITNEFPQVPNVLRVKNRLRGDVPDGAVFQTLVQCGGGFDRLLTFTTNSYQEILVPVENPGCRVTQVRNGGATSTAYRASSATADVTDGPRSAFVDFGGDGGQRAKVVVANAFPA